MNINDIATRAHNHAKKAGFLDPRISDSMLMDLVDEVSEARKAYKGCNFANKSELDCFNYFDIEEFKDEAFSRFTESVKDTYEDELTDILLIVLSVMKHSGMNIEKHIEAKMKYNELREDHK